MSFYLSTMLLNNLDAHFGGSALQMHGVCAAIYEA